MTRNDDDNEDDNIEKIMPTDKPNNIENIDKIEMPSNFENSPTINQGIFENERPSVDLDTVKNTDMNMDKIEFGEEDLIKPVSDQEDKDYNPTPLEDIADEIKDERITANSSAVFDDLMTVLMNYDAEDLTLELQSDTVYGTTYMLTANTNSIYGTETETLYIFNEMTKETKTLLKELGVTDNTKIGTEDIELFMK